MLDSFFLCCLEGLDELDELEGLEGLDGLDGLDGECSCGEGVCGIMTCALTPPHPQKKRSV